MKTQNHGGVHISIPHTYNSEVVDRMAEGPVSCAGDVWTHFLLQLESLSSVTLLLLPLLFFLSFFPFYLFVYVFVVYCLSVFSQS